MATGTTAVTLANQALDHLGTFAQIEDLSEARPEARKMARWYPRARREVLSAHDWNFARRRLALASHSEDPPQHWGFRYQYPADCLVFRRIQHPLGPQADQVPFEIEQAADKTRSILTNLEQATGVFTRDEEDTGLFPPLVEALIARLLAAYTAYSLTKKLEVEKRQLELYNSEIKNVPVTLANEEAQAPPRDADWIRYRHAGLFDPTFLAGS